MRSKIAPRSRGSRRSAADRLEKQDGAAPPVSANDGFGPAARSPGIAARNGRKIAAVPLRSESAMPTACPGSRSRLPNGYFTSRNGKAELLLQPLRQARHHADAYVCTVCCSSGVGAGSGKRTCSGVGGRPNGAGTVQAFTQADRTALPFARRRARTLRPFAVAILLRKPWTFARWRFLG